MKLSINWKMTISIKWISVKRSPVESGTKLFVYRIQLHVPANENFFEKSNENKYVNITKNQKFL